MKKKHLILCIGKTLCGRLTTDNMWVSYVDRPELKDNIWYHTTDVFAQRYCRVCCKVLHAERPV